jgi:hypothetical protein
MAIDTSGKWWVGSDPRDLADYLEAFSEISYKTSEFRLSQCQWGGLRFKLGVQADEGIAKRTCESCGAEHFILTAANTGKRTCA